VRCAIGNGHKILIVSVSVRDYQDDQCRSEWPSGSEGVLAMQSLRFRMKCAVAGDLWKRCPAGILVVLCCVVAFLEIEGIHRP
jgi:hypothetical protein